jgi:hypothetical protein
VMTLALHFLVDRLATLAVRRIDPSAAS